MMRKTLGYFAFLLLIGNVVQSGAQARKTLPQPTERRNLYPENVDAKAEIAEALADATKTHRRVLLIFGGN